MIKKEITMSDGRKYIVGFKEVGSSFKCIECHILNKTLFFHNSVYSKLHGKGLFLNYHDIALWTIFDYERECDQVKEFLEANWT